MTDRPSRAGSATRLGAVLVVLLSASLLAQPKTDNGDRVFGLTKVHKIHLTLSSAEWSVLQTSAVRSGGATGGSDYRLADGRMIHVGSGFGGYFPWVHADARVDDADFKGEFKDVGIRYKGNLSFQSSSAAAPLFANFKLKIDQHDAKGSWDGERTFNFHAGVVDNSRMRDALAYAVFRGAGVPAPRTAYAELIFTVPGVYQSVSAGLFTMIEDVNKKFLSITLPPGTGLLMKPEGLRGGVQSFGDDWSRYIAAYRPDREATPHEQQRLIEFGRIISQPDVALFRSKVGTYLDVEEFLRFIAVNALIVNSDSYLGGGHNFYLYLDPKDDKFRFIPWDQDLSMGSRGFPMGAAGAATGADILQPWRGDQPLIYWLMEDPNVAARYRVVVKDIVTRVFNRTEMLKVVDALEALGVSRANSPRTFIESRTAYAEQVVAGWK